MAKKKIRIIGHPDEKTLEIDGKTYVVTKVKNKKIGDIVHTDYVQFGEIDAKEYKKKLEFIYDKLEKSIDKRRILEEVFKDFSYADTIKIYNSLKKKAKVKTQDGCLGIVVDGGKWNRHYITLYD